MDGRSRSIALVERNKIEHDLKKRRKHDNQSRNNEIKYLKEKRLSFVDCRLLRLRTNETYCNYLAETTCCIVYRIRTTNDANGEFLISTISEFSVPACVGRCVDMWYVVRVSTFLDISFGAFIVSIISPLDSNKT